MDLGQQFSRLGFKTQGLPEARRMGAYYADRNRHDADTFKGNQSSHDYEAALDGGHRRPGTERFRTPHPADTSFWYIQHRYGTLPKSTMN